VRRRTARALTALADGTLPPQRRELLLRRVTRSSRLSRALAQQVLAIDVVRSLANPAPAGLRAWVERASREALASGRRGGVE
jgi:hypothetical protein